MNYCSICGGRLTSGDKCPYCGASVAKQPQSQNMNQPLTIDETQNTCHICGGNIPQNALKCLYCGTPVVNIQQPQTQYFNQSQDHNQYYQPPAQPYQNSIPQASYNFPFALLLGLAGIVFSFLIPALGHICSIAGIFLGFREYTQTGKLWGLLFSGVGEILSIISTILIFLLT